MLEGVIPLETFPLVEWHEGELADVPIFTVLKTQISVTRPQCVKKFLTTEHVPRITDFCICMYVLGCRLSLFRLCDNDFGITPVDDITNGIT